MLKILPLHALLIFSAASLQSQTICGTVAENSNLVLTAPAGMVFNAVVFASYGTPGGTCGSFTIGGCHASGSSAIVLSYINNQNTATIPATNGVFTDPCVGTFKSLYVEASYTTALPVKLISFNGALQNDAAILTWQTADEINTSHFDVEMSTDGINFTKVSWLKSANTGGTHNYSLQDFSFQAKDAAIFYRLKMVDLNGAFTYSAIVKLVKPKSQGLFSAAPNPVINKVYISGLKQSGTYQAKITNIAGKTMAVQTVSRALNTINLSGLASGIYTITIYNGGEFYALKVMKQ